MANSVLSRSTPLKGKLGDWDLYHQVFDPTQDDEASLADDIADIYSDLKEGLAFVQAGLGHKPEKAIFTCESCSTLTGVTMRWTRFERFTFGCITRGWKVTPEPGKFRHWGNVKPSTLQDYQSGIEQYARTNLQRKRRALHGVSAGLRSLFATP